MNLHEHSQTHNWEMGISFFKSVDPDIYSDALREIKEIEGASKDNPKIKFHSAKSTPQQQYQNKPHQKTIHKPKEPPKKGVITKMLDTVLGEMAFCIRCGEPLDKYNIEKPLCDRCYPIWAQFKKSDYPETYCHACGEKKPNISYQKPVCRDCFSELYK